ncbi:MAG: hypothetical protein J1G01_05280 [Clostridiales bacterium]|nr:hypothetical protein [Clostridiales bacterium]
MTVYAICPFCSKTISVEQVARLTCPECGAQFGFAELQKNHLLIDTRVEARELTAARDLFRNSEFLGAYEHFKKALEANKNSYSATYLSMLCDIYLHESDENYDLMGNVVNMITSALDVMARSNTPVADKLRFITAMLSETKIIIMRRLTGRNDLFENDIDKYRDVTIADLTKLLELFKIDREKIMSFSQDVVVALMEIIICAVKTCYKAVQTVVVGEELHSPNGKIYKQLLSLCNDYCFFGQAYNPDFDGNNYSPDFTQNCMLNDKVLSSFAKFDEQNKSYAKKHLIGNIEEYNKILAECKKALKLTYLNCYRSMCTRQSKQHAGLFFDGLKLVYRLLLPRVSVNNKKKVDIHVDNFVDVVDNCDILTRFLVDSYELDNNIASGLHEFYENLYEIVELYYLPDVEKIMNAQDKLKGARKEELGVYLKVLYDCACCCALALNKYVDFSVGKDKTREKLVKLCKYASEGFLVLSNFTIEELEQSNFYRPILQISSALLDELGE